VRVTPSADPRLAQRVAAALVAAGRAATVVHDTLRRDGVAAAAVALHPVGGIVGMSAEVLWALSPDRCALLAVHDPTAVENDPVPDAFVYVREGGGPPVAHERVWDVAVSPDWRRLAYSRAWMLQGRERDSLTTAEWEAVARETGTSAAAVRSAAFPVSSMSLAWGVAQPVLVELASTPDPGRAATGARVAPARPLATLGGWRLRWVAGPALALGVPPASTMDDAPSTRWVLVDPGSGRPLPGAARPLRDDTSLARGERWERGPTIDIGLPVDAQPRRIDIPGARVESRDGWVSVVPVVTAPAAAAPRSRVVGPGIALAATAGGRFILALAPKLRPREYEAPMELVVYEVAP
jgi:GNAT superfamily N-acetyltransferase